MLDLKLTPSDIGFEVDSDVGFEVDSDVGFEF